MWYNSFYIKVAYNHPNTLVHNQYLQVLNHVMYQFKILSLVHSYFGYERVSQQTVLLFSLARCYKQHVCISLLSLLFSFTTNRFSLEYSLIKYHHIFLRCSFAILLDALTNSQLVIRLTLTYSFSCSYFISKCVTMSCPQCSRAVYSCIH